MILIIVLLLLLLGGGGYGYHAGWYGGYAPGGVGLVVFIVLIYLLLRGGL